jgi:hypothetical protein
MNGGEELLRPRKPPVWRIHPNSANFRSKTVGTGRHIIARIFQKAQSATM